MLAVAAAVMAIAGRASWERSVRAQASFQVGADARVTLPSSASLPPGQVAAITGAPGVTASSPAVRQSLNLPNSASGNLLALDTKAAAEIIPRAAAARRPRCCAASRPPGQAGVRIPGRPAAIRFTVLAARSRLGRLSVTASVSDAAGISYALPGRLGSCRRAAARPAGQHRRTERRLSAPADRFHRRLQHSQRQDAGPASHDLGRRGAARRRRVPAGFLRRLGGLAGSLVRQPGHRRHRPGCAGGRTQAGSLTFRFSPGVFGAAFRQEGVGRFGTGHGHRRRASSRRPVPAVVTRSLLAATGMHVGDQMQVTAGSTTFLVVPVAAVRFLPGDGQGPAVLVDQRTLAGALAAAGAAPDPVTEWWLRTSGHLSLGALPGGTSVLTRQRLTAALLADPLAAAAQQAQLAIAAAAVLLALLALLIGVLTADRSRDLALLDALGMPPGQVARMLAFEQILTGIATAAVGLLVGYLLTRLIVPADT